MHKRPDLRFRVRIMRARGSRKLKARAGFEVRGHIHVPLARAVSVAGSGNNSTFLLLLLVMKPS